MATAGEVSWWVISGVEGVNLSGVVRGTSDEVTTVGELDLSALLDLEVLAVIVVDGLGQDVHHLNLVVEGNNQMEA